MICCSIVFIFIMHIVSSLCDCSLFPVSTKIEKEKREHAKQHGMIRTEITGAEIAEEMEKERRLFQLQMCEVGCKITLSDITIVLKVAFSSRKSSRNIVTTPKGGTGYCHLIT